MLGNYVQVGIGILRTFIADTKAIMAQTGDAATGEVEADNVTWMQHVGLISRPPKPVAGKQSAEAVSLRFHDHDVIVASRDLRGLELAGQLGEGETCIYAAGPDGQGQARLLVKGDGAIAMYALKGNAPGGDSVTMQLLPSGEIHLAGPFGGMSIVDGKVTMLSASGSGVQLDASGVSLLGQTIVANGTVVLGDDTAMGVMTQGSALIPLIGTLCTTLAAWLNDPLNVGATAASQTAKPAAAAATALLAALTLPASYSLKVKASP